MMTDQYILSVIIFLFLFHPQTVVASIACDPNVWNAMMDNHVLKDFLQSHQRSKCCLIFLFYFWPIS